MNSNGIGSSDNTIFKTGVAIKTSVKRLQLHAWILQILEMSFTHVTLNTIGSHKKGPHTDVLYMKRKKPLNLTIRANRIPALQGRGLFFHINMTARTSVV